MNITIVVIEHEYGITMYPCATPTIAYAKLYEYVQRYWDDEFPDNPVPEGSQAAINQYFEENEREFYTIETMELIDTLQLERATNETAV